MKTGLALSKRILSGLLLDQKHILEAGTIWADVFKEAKSYVTISFLSKPVCGYYLVNVLR